MNANLVINKCKEKKLTIIGIDGKNIVDKDKKSLLAILWQLLREDYIKFLGNMTEESLVKWANEKVKEIQIKNLKDPILKKGKFLLKLCDKVQEGIVDQ